MSPVQHFNEKNGTQFHLVRRGNIALMKTCCRAYGPLPSLQRRGLDFGWVLLPFLLLALSIQVEAQCPDEIDVLQPISCSGADDGVLIVSLPSGIDASDVYWLIESDTLFGAVQSNLGPGSYLAFVPGCPPLGSTLNEPFPFFISSSVSQLPTCDDPCSGEITVTPNFGATPVTYSWSHNLTETGPLGTGVCEQVVLVSATDANGCTDEDIVTVEIPPGEVLAFGTDPGCNGFADGSVSAVATGGLGGEYSFSWVDAQGNAVGSGADVLGLQAGSYTVTATDIGGCSSSTSVSLFDPPPVQVNTGSSAVSCNGEEDGTAFADFDSAAFFEWTGPNGFSASGPDLDALTGLAPGTYSVVVIASDGCLGSGAVTVEEPGELVADSFVSPPSCPGLSNGTVGVVPVGGTSPYTVSWVLPSGDVAFGLFLNEQPAGLFEYNVVDALGCEATGSVALVDQDPVEVDIQSTPLLCADGPGSDSGSISATVSGGVGPYSATWVNPATLDVVGTGLNIEGLSAGTYGVGISDQLGCTLDTLVEVSAPDTLNVSVLATMPTCFGDGDGSALAVVEGGTPDYIIVWSGSINPAVGLSVSGLGTGDYTATAVDANGCVAEVGFVLQAPEPLVFEVNTMPVGCDGSDGALIATVSGGIPDYAVLWSGSEGSIGDGLELVGIEAGEYTGILTDANGCTSEWFGTVEVLPELDVAVSVSVVDCSEGTAELEATASGGAAPLSLTVSGPEGPVSAVEWPSLSPGEYSVTAMDFRGCTVDTFWVVNPALIFETSVVSEGCTGPGQITASASGGTASYTYNALPVGAPSVLDSSGATWHGLSAGIYAVSVSDGVCTAESEVLLEGFSLFDWNLTSLDFACASSPGAASVAVIGGAEPISFYGSSLDGAVVWDSPEASGLPAGEYVLSVVDAAGCERDTSFVLAALPELTLSVTATPISCHAANDGQILVEAAGGSEPLIVVAEGPEGILLEPLEGLTSGTYLTGVVDIRGCALDTLVSLVEPSPLSVEATSFPESCDGIADGMGLLVADGGSGLLSFQWDGGPQDSVWSGLNSGTYLWTVIDAQGCDTSGTVVVESGGGLDVMVTVEIEPCEGNSAQAEVNLTVTGNVDSAAVLLGGLPADLSSTTDTTGIWSWTGLPSGTYGWTAGLGPGCETSGQAEVLLPEPLAWAGSVLQPLCSSDSGMVSLFSEGGVAPVLWSWSGVSVSGDSLSGSGSEVGALPEGMYTFVAFDSLGCSLVETIGVTPISSGLNAAISLVQPSCGGALVGEATVTPTGGIPPYEIEVEGAVDSLFIPFLVPGLYPFSLLDSIGCLVEDTLIIEPASAFELVATVDSATCANTEDGLILLETNNGVGEADFTFVGPFGALPSTDSIPDLSSGIYEVTAIDEAGCPAVLFVSVGAPPPVVVLLDSLDRPSCAGDQDGALFVSVSGGSGAGYDIQWTTEGVLVGGGAVLDGVGEGIYAVEVTDGAGCSGDIASIPLVAEGDVVLTVPNDTALCAGIPFSMGASAQGATDLSWSLSGGTTGLGLTASTDVVVEGESHWVFTASRLGCVRTDSVIVTGWALPIPDAGADAVVTEGGSAALGGAVNPDWVYSWEPALDVVSPELAATATQPMSYATEFILTATSSEGCIGVDTVWVNVLLALDIPSGFTPNGDGVNDRWNLGGLDQYPSAEITLFNRWGDVLMTFGSTDGPWDGRLNGTDVPVGTYYYHVRVDEPAMQAEWTGPITLMR
ncbi:MAG: hypothetical protein CL849_01245 [Crocinitomicaceae bacterium]|nr:hypothetical protein [Crocinitomicaceae bacterium]